MWAHHEPRGAQYMGVNWVGPTIMRHGTPAQQAQHLPAIARGEVIWCQGFSEPNAGSDLASLRTAARPDGDGWLVSGQKIWTSYATMAQWCFLLARTSRGEKKQQGLTIFLVPMSAPGIEVRPIPCMIGPHHLNEVFFDDVRVTEADVLGEVDQGWQVVQEVLAFERVGIARYARCERLLRGRAHGARRQLGRLAGGVARPLGADARALPAGAAARVPRGRRCRTNGRVRPADTAAYRIAVTRLDQESADVLMEILTAGPSPASPLAEWWRHEVEDHWRYSQAATVSSGSHRNSADPARPRPAVAAGSARMNVELSDEATEFGREASRAFEAAGGDQLVEQVEQNPDPARLRRARADRTRRVGTRRRAAIRTSWKLLQRCVAAPAGSHCRTQWPSDSRDRPITTRTG